MELLRSNAGPVDITNTQPAPHYRTEMNHKINPPMTKLEKILKNIKDSCLLEPTKLPEPEDEELKNIIKHTFVNEGIQKRAILTLPEVLLLKTSTKKGAVKSIYTVEPLLKGTKFGPYEGEIKEKGVTSRFCWEIFRDGKLHHYIDGHDDSKSTWMKFVRFASPGEEPNLIAYQHKEEIYFETIQDVPANAELLLQVWNVTSSEPNTDKSSFRAVEASMADDSSELIRSSPTSNGTDAVVVTLDHNENEQKSDERKALLRRLYCSTCGKKFQDKHKLRRHELTHTNEKPFACSKCQKRFRRSDTVKTHIKNCHSDGAKWIQITTATASITKVSRTSKRSKSILRRLFQRSRPSYQTTQICPICSKQISTCNFSRHIKVHTRPYKCRLCHKRFSRPADGKRHLLKHHKIKDGKNGSHLWTGNYIEITRDTGTSDVGSNEKVSTSDSAGEADSNLAECRQTDCQVISGEEDISMPCFPVETPAGSNQSCSGDATESAFSGDIGATTTDTSNHANDGSTKLSSDKPVIVVEDSASDHSSVTGPSHCLPDKSKKEIGEADCSSSDTIKGNTVKQLACPTCGKVLSSNSKLNRHILIHTGIKPYTCDVCGQGFSRSEYVKNHKLRFHKEELEVTEDDSDVIDISCIFSAFLGDTNQALNDGVVSPPVTHIQRMESVYDGGVYIKEGELLHKDETIDVKELQEHGGPEEKSELSSETSADGHHTADDFSMDMKEEGLIAVGCNDASISLQKIPGLVTSGYSCEVCSRVFASKLKLRRHMPAHSRPYHCTACNKSFSQLHSYKSHKLTRVHQEQINLIGSPSGSNGLPSCEPKSEEVNMEENSCDSSNSGILSTPNNTSKEPRKDFVCSSQLSKLAIDHSGMKPFECPECGKTFTQSGNLKTHLSRVHAKARDPCPVCGQCFSCLKNHMKVHTGEKPYTCSVCGRAFSQSGNLRVHERKQHLLFKR